MFDVCCQVAGVTLVLLLLLEIPIAAWSQRRRPEPQVQPVRRRQPLVYGAVVRTLGKGR